MQVGRTSSSFSINANNRSRLSSPDEQTAFQSAFLKDDMTSATDILTNVMKQRPDWSYHHSPIAHSLAARYRLTKSTPILFSALLRALLHKSDDVVSGRLRGDSFWDLCVAEVENLSKDESSWGPDLRSAVEAAGGSARGVCHRLFFVLMVGDADLSSAEGPASVGSLVEQLNRATQEDFDQQEQARKESVGRLLKKWEGVSEKIPAASFYLEALRSWDIDANWESDMSHALVRVGLNEDKANLVARGMVQDTLPAIQQTSKEDGFSACCVVATISGGVLVLLTILLFLLCCTCRGDSGE